MCGRPGPVSALTLPLIARPRSWRLNERVIVHAARRGGCPQALHQPSHHRSRRPCAVIRLLPRASRRWLRRHRRLLLLRSKPRPRPRMGRPVRISSAPSRLRRRSTWHRSVTCLRRRGCHCSKPSGPWLTWTASTGLSKSEPRPVWHRRVVPCRSGRAAWFTPQCTASAPAWVLQPGAVKAVLAHRGASRPAAHCPGD